MDALDALLDREGGYVNDPTDKGGETAWGITKKFHPEMWVSGPPSREAAKKFYQNEMTKMGLTPIASPLKEHLFDFAVNSGPTTAVKHLQRILGVADDGVIGAGTLAALVGKDATHLSNLLAGSRANMIATFVSTNPSQVKFLKGWMARVTSFLI